MTLSKHPINTNQVTGLILAGGAGRRVNNKDKGLLNYRGITLLEYQVNWIQSQVTNILISANRNISQYRHYGFRVVIDDSENFLGPLQGVLKGLEQCETEWLFVQPVDMPKLPNNTVRLLLDAVNKDLTKESSSCYFLKSNQREHFLCMLISTTNLQALSGFLARGESRVRDFHQTVNSSAVDINISENYFINLNTLSDY